VKLDNPKIPITHQSGGLAHFHVDSSLLLVNEIQEHVIKHFNDLLTEILFMFYLSVPLLRIIIIIIIIVIIIINDPTAGTHVMITHKENGP
jgi:hypothetical protein